MARRGSILIAILAAGIFLWWVAKSVGPGEPVYNGKKLTRWMAGHVASSVANPPYGSAGWKEADEALRHIGTNGIPILLREIQVKDQPRAWIKFLEWAHNRRLPYTEYRYAYSRREEARYMFEILETNGALAMPGLIEIYRRERVPDIQRCVASALNSIGAAARPALPLLLADFTNTNNQMRFDAVSAVIGIGGEPDVVLPAMMAAMKDADVNIRWNASVSLSEYGGRARIAVPILLDALQDTGTVGTSPIRGQIETALWRIAPEKVGRPLIVETNTPMVAAGQTVASVDVVHGGKRRTIIRAGKSVPHVAQFWSQQPRGEFELYRGDSPGTNAEHFFGQFEVVGIPEPPNEANVSLLCVIADGQIVLCARDNMSEKFLEVRKLK